MCALRFMDFWAYFSWLKFKRNLYCSGSINRFSNNCLHFNVGLGTLTQKAYLVINWSTDLWKIANVYELLFVCLLHQKRTYIHTIKNFIFKLIKKQGTPQKAQIITFTYKMYLLLLLYLFQKPWCVQAHMIKYRAENCRTIKIDVCVQPTQDCILLF